MSLNGKEYFCSCHCGNIRYQIKLPKELAITDTSKCNCSFCLKTRGWEIKILKNDFKLVQGTPKLYKFGSQTNDYYFCDTCGIQLYGLINFEIPDAPFYVISVPTIDGLNEEDFEQLSSQVYYMNGKDDKWEVSPKCTKYL